MIADIDAIRGQLEPHYDNLDHIIEDIIRPQISVGVAKYYECCRFKLKAIWYTERKIQKLDEKYKAYLSEHLSSNGVEELPLIEKSRKGNKFQCYFPIYEAVEFENLLSQGKACLDCFSKALGSIYHESPNNITKLISVLEQNRDRSKVGDLLEVLENTNKLLGVVIDPKAGKKSIRDLINHRERVDIFFTIRKSNGSYTLSQGAMLNMDHPELVKFPNYLVTNISAKIHALLSGIIEKSFKIQFEC